ncbi:MAG TPA: IclR family transcriptional regulator [Burkholderiales bacterium]|nr:IclR family transcriptional regulator [Burkholderiales bacterium]
MRGVDRTLAVFECFSAASPKLSLQEISNRIGLAKSTTHRVVSSLEASGYLVRLRDQRYCLSLKFARLGGIAQDTLDVRQAARPFMEALADASGESVTLFSLEKQEFVCLDVVTTPAPLMSLNRPGDRAPLGLGAASLVLLAHLPQAELKAVLPAVARRVKHTQRDLVSILANVRRQRYAVSHGGNIPGISSLGAPVSGADDAVRLSLNIVMPTARVQGRVAPLLRLLREAASQVSSGLGASAPRNL